jgi:hypothetical protein
MDQEQKLELGSRIWELRKAGYDRIQILQELGITVHQLEECLLAFEFSLSADVARAMEHYFYLDNERIEEVIEALIPIALGDPDHPLETASDREFDLALRASYAVLGCIDARQKIMAASQPEKTKSVREGSCELLVWLQQLHTGAPNSGQAARRRRDRG